MLACPSHSCTFAMSALCARALVAPGSFRWTSCGPELQRLHSDIFQQILKSRCLAYINEKASAVKQGRVIVSDAMLLYPNLILFLETADHFIAEVFITMHFFSAK